MTSSTIAFYLPSLAGGGAERSMLRLMSGLAARGWQIELVLNHARGPYLGHVPKDIRVIELERASKWRQRIRLAWRFRREPLRWRYQAFGRRKPILKLQFLNSLIQYMQTSSASTMVCAMYEANMLAVCARACSASSMKLIVSARNDLSLTVAERCQSDDRKHWRDLPRLISRLYCKAEHIVAVSHGVADDLANAAHIDRERITTIYNPVVADDFTADALGPADHPWLVAEGPPVILAVGRLEPQKDFSCLLDAFAQLAPDTDARLIILGEGWQRHALQQQAQRLGIADRLDLHGWVAEPRVYLKTAALFVSSSRYEGLPGALIEALSCGCPVIATDCPSGPREILNHGEWGRLVPVGNAECLAHAIRATLDEPPLRANQAERGRFFSVSAAVTSYERLITGNSDTGSSSVA